MSTNKPKILSIQFLRGIGAIMVAFCHTSLPDWGRSGVELFFIMSGFITMYSTEKNADNFWIKRILKIVPLYWLMTLVTGACVIIAPQLFKSYEVSTEYLLKSLLFIPYKHSGIRQPVLGLGWTLNLEMFFYLIFWIATKISHSKRGLYTILMLGTLTTIKFLYKIPMPFSVWTNNVLLEFCYGIILFYLYKKFSSKLPELKHRTLAMFIFWPTLIIGILCMDSLLYVDLPRGLSSGLMGMLVVAFVLFFEKNISFPRALIYVGNISYVLYLTHMYPVRLVEKLIPCSGIFKLPVAILAILIAIVCAGIWNHYIEENVQRYLHKKFITKK